jgi:hypothetical protein
MISYATVEEFIIVCLGGHIAGLFIGTCTGIGVGTLCANTKRVTIQDAGWYGGVSGGITGGALGGVAAYVLMMEYADRISVPMYVLLICGTGAGAFSGWFAGKYNSRYTM